MGVLIKHCRGDVRFDDTCTNGQQQEGHDERSHTLARLENRRYDAADHDDMRDVADQDADKNGLEATSLSISQPATKDRDQVCQEYKE